MQRNRFRTDDIEIAYVRSGRPSEAKVVLLHGMAETSESCWSDQIEALSTTYDVYAVDLRGHGQTTLGNADGTLEQLGRDLLAFLEGVTGPSAVVGFSMGGTIALWAAAQRSPFIEHAISVGGSSVISRATAGFFGEKADTVAARQLTTLHAEIGAEVVEMFALNPDRAAAYGARRIAAVGEGDGYANAGLAMAGMRDVPLQPLLADITCPVDIVGGEFDKWCPRKASDIILDGLTGVDARFTEIGGVGHLMSVDDPDTVSAQLARLIENRPPAGSGAAALTEECSK